MKKSEGLDSGNTSIGSSVSLFNPPQCLFGLKEFNEHFTLATNDHNSVSDPRIEEHSMSHAENGDFQAELKSPINFTDKSNVVGNVSEIVVQIE